LYRIIYPVWPPGYECAGGESPYQFEAERRRDIFPGENAIRTKLCRSRRASTTSC